MKPDTRPEFSIEFIGAITTLAIAVSRLSVAVNALSYRVTLMPEDRATVQSAVDAAQASLDKLSQALGKI